MSNEQHEHGKAGEDHGRDMVRITMTVDDGEPAEFSIHRGHQTVAQIKTACGVSPAYAITQIEADGTLKVLPEDGGVTLKGGERFIAHVRGGGSS